MVAKKDYYRKIASTINLDEIIANLPGHIYWKDADCVLLGCNSSQAEDSGLASREDIVGLSAYDLLYQYQSEAEKRKQAEITDRIDKEIMMSNQQSTVEELVVMPDQTNTYFLSTKVPLHDKDKNVIGLLGVSVDITERKKAEQAILVAKEKAESADRAKTNFIRDMGHDFRTPIANLKNTSEALLMQIEYSKTGDLINQILEECETGANAANNGGVIKNVMSLTRDLKAEMDAEISDAVECLTCSKLASDRLIEFFNAVLEQAESASEVLINEPELTNINDFLVGLKEMYAPAAISKQLDFKVEVDPKTPVTLSFDSGKLQRILMNLIGNALKFTDQGYIHLLVDVDASSKGDNLLRFIVRDTAGGIPEDKLDTIFASFTQLTQTDRSRGGYGLGLSIVKSYLDCIGGEVKVESELGKGSDFIVLLPML